MPSESGTDNCSVNLSVSPNEREADVDHERPAATGGSDPLDRRDADQGRGRGVARRIRAQRLAPTSTADRGRRGRTRPRQSRTCLTSSPARGDQDPHRRAGGAAWTLSRHQRLLPGRATCRGRADQPVSIVAPATAAIGRYWLTQDPSTPSLSEPSGTHGSGWLARPDRRFSPRLARRPWSEANPRRWHRRRDGHHRGRDLPRERGWCGLSGDPAPDVCPPWRAWRDIP